MNRQLMNDMNIITCYTGAALTYSATRYDSAICSSKMTRDAFLGEALYEADTGDLQKRKSANFSTL